MERRTFLTKSTLAGAGMSLPLSAALATGAPTSLSNRWADLGPLDGRFMITGPGVAGIGNRLTIVAEITDYSALAKWAETRDVQAMGSKLSFRDEELHVTVENLPREDYSRRLRDVLNGSHGRFCHDAVMYAPGTLGWSDPYGVFAHGDPCVEPRSEFSRLPAREAFLTLLQGLMAAGGLWEGSASFGTQREQLLKGSPANREEAREVGNLLLQHIVPLSAALSGTEVERLLQSHLVSASLVLADGRSSARMVRARGILRSYVRSGATPGELWLAVLLGAGAHETDAPSRATGSEDPYAADLTREALPGALAVLARAPIALPVAGEGLAGSDYESWSAAFVPAIAAEPYSDPDRDGMSSLVEYGLGLDPQEFSTAGLPVLGEAGEGAGRFLTLRYQRDLTKTDIRYQVETSSTLREDSWTTAGVSDEPAGPGTESHLQPRLARVLRDGPRRFLRLRVTRSR